MERKNIFIVIMFADMLKKVVRSNKNLEYIVKLLKENNNIECKVFDMDLNIIVMDEVDEIGKFMSSENTNAIEELKKVNKKIIGRLLPKLLVRKKENDMYLQQLGTRPWEKPMSLPASSNKRNKEIENAEVVDLNYKIELADQTLIYKEQLGNRDVKSRF